MNIKYQKWDDITLSKYDEIQKIVNDNNRDEIEKNVGLIAALTDEDEDKIWDLTLPELNALADKIEWINNFKFDKKKKFKSIVLNKVKYDFTQSIDKLSVAQYVDFQMTFTDDLNPTVITNLLSIFIVPRGHKYNEGYDIEELKDIIYNSISLPTAQSMLFFFIKKSLCLIRSSLQFLETEMRVQKRITNNQIQKDRLQQMIEQAKEMKEAFTIG